MGQGNIVSVVTATFTVVGLWGGTLYLFYDDPNRGTFGDMFGAVNALFTGLAFLALIFTILQQKDELGLQRQELEWTRDELRGQKENLAAQNRQIALQNFEGTFFQMMRLHNDSLNAIDLTSKDNQITHTGRDCFRIFWEEGRSYFHSQDIPKDPELRRKEIMKGYEIIWTKYSNELSHYFRLLYNIIKFVDNAEIENKKFYTNIIRAQLSVPELFLLFYNCIFFSDLKLKPLVEKYSILKHLDHEALPMKFDLSFYHQNAYK